jgi:hypothetical protein
MTRKLLPLILIAAVVIFFSGCKKDETPDEGASTLNPGQSQISCSVSGAASSSFTSNILISTAIRSDLLLNISGGNANVTNPEIVMIILPRSITTGTYNSSAMDNGEFAFTFTSGSSGWANDKTKPFSIVVTTVTATEVEGTFSGTLINDDNTTVDVSSGKFAAKFAE